MARRSRSQRSAADSTRHENGNGATDEIRFVSITDETRRRYLNYAMSVIMARALPDVRDGLKPVQRRIMFTMFHDLHLTANAKYRKCAKIVGDTTGNYHPHGTDAVYDALVRLAQDFTLRGPLIEGHGNFGSIIGLPPAAERYTEARLTALAEQLMNELRYETVEMRPTYDAENQEPVVLPARYPNLLVNGAQGIAVGMATSLPPHNLGELIKGCVFLIQNSGATVPQVMKYVKGPDFPLGGRIVSDRRDLTRTYKEGRGSIKVRAEWKVDSNRRRTPQHRLVIYSIPYGVETGNLMSLLGEIRDSRKLPQLIDVIDESDDQSGLRIIVEVRSAADTEAVMAYLYKHTPLEQNFSYNATCLVPDPHGAVVPQRCSLVEMLQHFLDFRFETVRRRFEFQLAQLEKRIHILRGFCIIFDGLDQALRIIRRSSGKTDAAVKLCKAFPLDEVQANAILEIQLYRISKLEIGRLREELDEKQADADRIRGILASDRKLWKIIQRELRDVSDAFATPRRTSIGSSDEIEHFDPQAYIVRENTNVVVTSEGWIRRLGKISSIDKLRVRDGDEVIAIVPCSTLDNVVFFSSDGTAYTLPAIDIPASTGYGEPIAKHVRISDGAELIAAFTTDSRFTPEDVEYEGFPPYPYLFVTTAQGQVMRISFSAFREPSTKAGRRYCRLRSGDRVVHVDFMDDDDTVFLMSRAARLIHFNVIDVPVLTAAGKGVRGLKLVDSGDQVLGARRLSQPGDCLYAVNENDTELSFGQMKYQVTSRGGKGVKTSQRTGIKRLLRREIEIIDWGEVNAE